MWYVYGLIFAICSSFITIIAKDILKNINEYIFILIFRIFTIFFLFLTIFIFFEFPQTDTFFIKAVLFSSILSAIGVFCDYRAIKLSEISLIAPISSFNPIFTTILSFIFLNEKITLSGFIGIFIIVIGAYLIRITDIRKGLFAPFQSLYKDIGVKYALCASLIWSISPLFFKVAIQHTDPKIPPFVSFVVLSLSCLLYIPFAIKKSETKNITFKIKRYLPHFILIGVLATIGEVAGFTAYSLNNLGYVTSLFRLSMVFTIILSWIFYKEKGIKNKLLGAIVMLIGVLMILK